MNEHHTKVYWSVAKVCASNKFSNQSCNRNAAKDVTPDHLGYLVSLTLNNQLRKPNFRIGDTVRIRKKLETFHKGYKLQFSHELFRISAILTRNPLTYRMVSHESNELITGSFYESELFKYQQI